MGPTSTRSGKLVWEAQLKDLEKYKVLNKLKKPQSKLVLLSDQLLQVTSTLMLPCSLTHSAQNLLFFLGVSSSCRLSFIFCHGHGC